MLDFADDKIKRLKNQIPLLGKVENIAGKGKIVGHMHFLLSPQCLLKASVLGSLKSWLVW